MLSICTSSMYQSALLKALCFEVIFDSSFDVDSLRTYPEFVKYDEEDYSYEYDYQFITENFSSSLIYHYSLSSRLICCITFGGMIGLISSGETISSPSNLCCSSVYWTNAAFEGRVSFILIDCRTGKCDFAVPSLWFSRERSQRMNSNYVRSYLSAFRRSKATLKRFEQRKQLLILALTHSYRICLSCSSGPSLFFMLLWLSLYSSFAS